MRSLTYWIDQWRHRRCGGHILDAQFAGLLRRVCYEYAKLCEQDYPGDCVIAAAEAAVMEPEGPQAT